MVLDFLPYKQPQNPRKEKLCFLRYVMFILSLALVSGLMLIKIANLEQIMFRLFIVGNVLYYILGIGLAFVLKDNRAFCKYLCPLGAIYGWFNPIAYYRMKVDQEACIHCGACHTACGMDIEVWKKPNSVECIRCGDCRAVCPTNAISVSGIPKFKGMVLEKIDKTKKT